MNFKEVLIQVADDFEMKLDEICFTVSTRDFDFPFSFFAFEDDNILGILVTQVDGAEKLHLIVKNEIVFFKIMYLDDLEMLYDGDENNIHQNVGLYE